jgi:hypothetical protein
VFQLTDV